MLQKFFKRFDWYLFAILILLSTVGILVIYSTAIGSNIESQLAQRQLFFFGAGLIVMFLLTLVNFELFKNYSYVFYFLSILVLVAVILFGRDIRGAASWFEIGSFRVQPSEFVKIFTVIVLGHYFSKFRKEMYQFRHVIISGLLVVIPVGLILLQPDLGSAMIIVSIWLGMLLISGINKIHILIVGGVLGLSAIISWSALLKDYQRGRLLTFLNPQLDPLGDGYNVIQSVIAVGSGGISGQGLGQGSQSQLNFLPEQHTDFIFAVLAEELGFIGAFFLIALLFFFVFRLLRAVKVSRNNFGFLVAVGLTVMFVSQILINIGMNLGIMPVAGIPLPLVSYGGSSMITSFIAIGIVQSIIIRQKKDPLSAE